MLYRGTLVGTKYWSLYARQEQSEMALIHGTGIHISEEGDVSGY